MDFINLASNPTDESGARDSGLSPKNLIKNKVMKKVGAGKNCPFGQSVHPAIFRLLLLLLCLCVCNLFRQQPDGRWR